MKVRFTLEGAEQYLAALDYTRARSPQGAENVRRRVEELVRALGEQPDLGRVIPEFPDLPYREHYVPPYRLFYRAVDDTVWIVGLWPERRSAQQLRGILRGLDTRVMRDESERDLP